jgi:hypothetical protein
MVEHPGARVNRQYTCPMPTVAVQVSGYLAAQPSYCIS